MEVRTRPDSQKKDTGLTHQWTAHLREWGSYGIMARIGRWLTVRRRRPERELCFCEILRGFAVPLCLTAERHERRRVLCGGSRKN